jgi:hypothetical protein
MKHVPQARRDKLIFDRVQATGALRVCRAGVMLLAGGMSYIGSLHDSLLVFRRPLLSALRRIGTIRGSRNFSHE